METTDFFGKEKIGKILIKLAPPVMAATLGVGKEKEAEEYAGL